MVAILMKIFVICVPARLVEVIITLAVKPITLVAEMHCFHKIRDFIKLANPNMMIVICLNHPLQGIYRGSSVYVTK